MAANTNAKQNIPELFKVIMETDREIEAIRKNLVIEFARIRELKKEKARLRTAAEKMLCWNVDKGNPLRR